MISKCLLRIITVISLLWMLGVLSPQKSQAQVQGPQEIKWLSVGQLQEYFSNCGMEIEYGRRGRGPYLNTDQTDGLRWPAQWQYQDHNVGKALWIGTTNFKDPSNGITYPYKVISLGRGTMYTANGLYTANVGAVTFPVQFSLVGKFNYPTVIVDGNVATNLASTDLNSGNAGEDGVDPTLPCDRMIYNVTNTPIGITITRKVYNWSQQYNDNYFIYEWTFKNTGLTDNAGGKISPVETLQGVVFSFICRLDDAFEAYREGWTVNASDDYGRNTINDCIGQDATHTVSAPNDFRAMYSYFGPDSHASGVLDHIGCPDYSDGHILGGADFTGEMVLHADKSTTDPTDDPNQPTTTAFLASDNPLSTPTNTSQFNSTSMTQQYQQMMIVGHDLQTQAEQLGEDANGWPTTFADTWGGSGSLGASRGGYQGNQSFGPYTIPPGDSIRIVICEAIAGMSHEASAQVAKNWYNWYNKIGTTPPLPLPSKGPSWTPSGQNWTHPTWTIGGTTTDGDVYKNAWVFTGRDSLMQTFQRARANYNGGFNIAEPPPPPDKFVVSSGGDRIRLQWSTSAESSPHFNGYRIYRATTKTDTIFAEITGGELEKATLSTTAPVDPATGLRTLDDLTPVRGFNYFYYIQTKDDGSTNNVEPGVPLVSSEFYTMTNVAASLRRPFGGAAGSQNQYSLSAIRIVPNPYNISAKGIQYGTDILVADQLSFFNLPPICTIRIFNDVGQLIQTINHTNGSGDESWNAQSSSGQVVASGLYIAYFEVTQDYKDPQTQKLLYTKGESTYKKFIIIR